MKGDVLVACLAAVLLAPSAAAAQGGGGMGGGGSGGGGGGGGGGPGEEEVAGNNLSFPVLFAEPKPAAIVIPSDAAQGAASLLGQFSVVGDYRAYLQKDEDNDWQAEWLQDVGTTAISFLDVSDNLESVPWRTTSTIRVEFVPFAGTLDLPIGLTAFEMLYVSGQGIDEVWGAAATNPAAGEDPAAITTLSPFATAHSTCQEISFTKLAADAGDIAVLPGAYTWDPATRTWLLAAYAEKVAATAEINVKGRLIYGYNWMLRRWDLPLPVSKAGWWRISFYSSCTGRSPLDLTTATGLVDPTAPPSSEGEVVVAEEGQYPNYPRVPVVVPGEDLVYVDVFVQARATGGGGKKDR